MNKRVGILTGGGDCPGLNSAIRAATLQALKLGYDVVGFKNGYKALTDKNPSYVTLTKDIVNDIGSLGGTILGSSRTNPFKQGIGTDQIKKSFNELHIDGLIAIGGEDTLGVCNKLYKDVGLPCVGIPKTIDLDLSYTEYSIGFESALNIITNSVDILLSTAKSHSRYFVVEVMGRNAGHLALKGGISICADHILLPEYDFSLDRLAMMLQKNNSDHGIILVSEGAKPHNYNAVKQNLSKDEFGHARLGGISNIIADYLEKEIKIDVRAINLSHLQRGGAPCSYDRRIGFYMGTMAADAIHSKKYGFFTAVKNGKLELAPISKGIDALRLVNIKNSYDTENYCALRSFSYNLDSI